MYAKASVLQIALAVIGTTAGVAAWYLSSAIGWLVGAVFLISVVPITLVFIKPINDQLLDSSNKLTAAEVEDLLRQWNPRHWARSIVSGIAFILFLVGLSH